MLKCLQPLLSLPTNRSIIDQSSLVRLKYQSMVWIIAVISLPSYCQSDSRVHTLGSEVPWWAHLLLYFATWRTETPTRSEPINITTTLMMRYLRVGRASRWTGTSDAAEYQSNLWSAVGWSRDQHGRSSYNLDVSGSFAAARTINIHSNW